MSAVASSYSGVRGFALDLLGFWAPLLVVLIWSPLLPFQGSPLQGAAGLLVLVLYCSAWALCLARGQTPGKAAFGIRVVRADWTPVDRGRVLLREVFVKGAIFYLPGGIILAVVAFFLWPEWDRDG